MRQSDTTLHPTAPLHFFNDIFASDWWKRGWMAGRARRGLRRLFATGVRLNCRAATGLSFR